MAFGETCVGWGCRCKWSHEGGKPEGNKDYKDMEKEASLLSVAPPRALLDFTLFHPCVCDHHVTPGTPWHFALTTTLTTLPAQPPIHKSHPHSPLPPHPPSHYLHTHNNPCICILQLLQPMYELCLLFLEDSEVQEAILVPMGVRRVCIHKGFVSLSMYIDTVQYYRNWGKI